VRVLRHTTTGDDELPQFGDWGTLTVDGIKVTVIALAYLLVPIVVLALSISALSGTLQMIGLVVGFVASLVAIYCLPAATTVFAREERFGASFTMSDIRHVVTNRVYLDGWIRTVVSGVLGGIVVDILGLIPILGFVVGLFITFFEIPGSAISGVWVRSLSPVGVATVAGETSTNRPRPARMQETEVNTLALRLADELIEFIFDECRNTLAISPECCVECLFGLVIDPIVSLEHRVFGNLRMVHADDAD
jgi:hypothetical protein